MNKDADIYTWLRQYIIELDLCPYAKATLEQEELQCLYGQLLESSDLLNLAIDVFQKNANVKTIFLVIQEELSFDQGLALLDFIEDELEDSELLVQFQTVLFHPHYQHDGIEVYSPLHFSHWAPTTIIQLLRHASIDALGAAKFSSSILAKNEKTLSNLGIQKLKQLHNELS